MTKMTKIAKSRIVVNTDQYKFSHGKEPKGRGYWGIELRYNGQPVAVVWNSGTYASAKSKAIKAAQDVHANEIVVLP